MATSTITRSKVDTIKEYFKRQYETEEGDLRENLEALFAEDLVYHMGDESISREDLLRITEGIRKSPKADRVVRITDAREEGDRAWFHLFIQIRHPESNELTVLENDHEWRFDDAGKVADVRPADADVVRRATKMFDIESR